MPTTETDAGQPAASFGVIDYAVFAFSLAASLAIGIAFAFTAGKQRTVSEYVHGNQRLGLLPVSISIVVSFISAIAILGGPADVYLYGIGYLYLPGGAVLACIVVAFCFVPVIYPLKMISLFEYLELRFECRCTRLVGTLINLIAELSYAGVTIYGPAIVIQGITGLPVWASMASTVALSTVYTALGGIKAVVWTDTFQSVAIVSSLLAVSIMGAMHIGDVYTIFEYLKEDGRLTIDYDPDPTRRLTLWAGLIGMGIQFMAMFTGQTSMQRISSLRTVTQAKLTLLLFAFGFAFISCLCSACGAIAYAYYRHKGCDPLRAGYILNPNQIVPYFVLEILTIPGLPGLFVACLYSAVLSTVSSIQNGLAANLWEDLFQPYLSHWSETRKTTTIKLLVVLLGGTALGLAFLASLIPGTLLKLAAVVFGVALGPRLGMLLLGTTTTYVGGKACSLAAVIGTACVVAMATMSILNPVSWPPLPTYTDNCSSINPLYNATGAISQPAEAGLMTRAVSRSLTLNSNDTFLDDTPYHQPSEPDRQFYHISPFYYTMVGLLITYLSGILLALIPVSGLRMRSHVDGVYLFPCIRKCRGSKVDGYSLPEKYNTLQPQPSPFLDTSRIIHQELMQHMRPKDATIPKAQSTGQLRTLPHDRNNFARRTLSNEIEIITARESCL